MFASFLHVLRWHNNKTTISPYGQARICCMPRKTLPANVVGPQIREARKKLGLTQDAFTGCCQLAGLDISRSTLGQIEARLRFVSDEELIILASLLGVTTDDLFPKELIHRLRGKKVKAARKN